MAGSKKNKNKNKNKITVKNVIGNAELGVGVRSPGYLPDSVSNKLGSYIRAGAEGNLMIPEEAAVSNKYLASLVDPEHHWSSYPDSMNYPTARYTSVLTYTLYANSDARFLAIVTPRWGAGTTVSAAYPTSTWTAANQNISDQLLVFGAAFTAANLQATQNWTYTSPDEVTTLNVASAILNVNSLRATAQTVLCSFIGNTIDDGGQIAMARVRGVRSQQLIPNASIATVNDFPYVAKQPGAYSGPLRSGAFGLWFPGGVNDEELVSLTAAQTDAGNLTGFVISGYTTSANPSNAILRVRIVTSFEFMTGNRLFLSVPSRVAPLEIAEAAMALCSVPFCTSNDGHKEVILKALRAVAPSLLGLLGPIGAPLSAAANMFLTQLIDRAGQKR